MHHRTNLELAIQHAQELRAEWRSIGDAILDHTGRS
jgi:hypothetical protein